MAAAKHKQLPYSRKEKKCSDVFSALGDPRRLYIVRSIIKHKALCVSEVAEHAKISIPAASQHLTILEDAGVLEGYRDGKKVCFELNRGNRVVRSVIKMLV